LRGTESFEDQIFVQNYANLHAIPFFTTQFDTKSFAETNKLSTQVAARELRYNWFYELLEKAPFDYILTAHHANDNLETFFIHLLRGTGLDGLVGIPVQNDKIIRPLLTFSRDEIFSFATEHKIFWREDSSNSSDKYLRNKIRHDLIPLLMEMNSNFLTTFDKTQHHLQESKELVEEASSLFYEQVATRIGEEIHFDLIQLKTRLNYNAYLYQWLNKYGFTAWEDIYDLVDSQSGKQVFSAKFRVVKDRDRLIVSLRNEKDANEEYIIYETQKEVNLPLKMAFSTPKGLLISKNTAIFVDEDKLQYPLVLRRWKQGDVFQPYGMGGRSKKVSKFFKDEKMSLLEKENCWILCSNNQLVWIVGIRQDERFKIEPTTKNKLQIALL
jgi:tRNA(Ile)-lysidine synthase